MTTPNSQPIAQTSSSNFQPDISKLSNSNTIPFSELFKQNPDLDSNKFIQVGNNHYRWEDSSTFTQEKSLDNESHKDLISDENSLTSDKSVDLTKTGVHSGLSIQLTPVFADQFLSELPNNIRYFVQELVSIVKSYNSKLNQSEYKFSFKALKLDVVLSEQSGKLSIQIISQSKELSDLFKANDVQINLSQYIKDKVPNIDLSLEFIERESQSGSSDSQDDNQQRSDDESTEEDD